MQNGINLSQKYRDSELVIGLVAPVGVNLDLVEHILSYYLQQFNYNTEIYKLSEYLENIDSLKSIINKDTPYNRTRTLMKAGNTLRSDTGYGGMLAALGISVIRGKRKKIHSNGKIDHVRLPRTAHVIKSLKHVDEVMVLRSAYAHGFFLLGISSSENNRRKYLENQKLMSEDEARDLIRIDQGETDKFGQHTRDVFELADGFVDMDAPDVINQFGRIFDLLFGNPYITPSQDEYAMYLAYASSLRSADLSRQVGAVIISKDGELISTGANDVPKFGGGLYWPHDKNLCRDIELKYDSNERKKQQLIESIMSKISNEICIDIKKELTQIAGEKKIDIETILQGFKDRIKSENSELISGWKDWVMDTDLKDITEYGRAVHAEMEALLSCARSGVSPRGGTIYTTTFPCHNCAKHIVDAGIKRVVFVEPYPKSKAKDLHEDTIYLPHEYNSSNYNNDKVLFEPFVGVGHRRFLDLFSMKSSTGSTIKRKEEGQMVNWTRNQSNLRVPLLPISYIDREEKVIEEASRWIID